MDINDLTLKQTQELGIRAEGVKSIATILNLLPATMAEMVEKTPLGGATIYKYLAIIRKMHITIKRDKESGQFRRVVAEDLNKTEGEGS